MKNIVNRIFHYYNYYAMKSVSGAVKPNNEGVTLIELVVVITTIVILAGALSLSFQEWNSGYNVESQIKEMHVDLMNTRSRSMQRNRMNFVDLTASQYSIYEDTNVAPDGDGISDPALDTLISQKSLHVLYPIVWSNPSDSRVEFNINGLSSDDKAICVNTTVNADYDCIVLSATRINMGKLTTSIPGGGACNAANCVEK